MISGLVFFERTLDMIALRVNLLRWLAIKPSHRTQLISKQNKYNTTPDLIHPPMTGVHT